ncbi:MAG: ribosome-associated translation inhibitor RaiA [Phycisphaerales bacterium]|nr:ribosome-associated translation inhibitor RaiA [Phycisphaerales bacterium]
MRTNVVGLHGIEVTDAIRNHAESKVKKLDKFNDLVQQIDLKFWKENTAKESFSVEIAVDVVNHPDFLAKAEGHDLYLVIDDAISKVGRQLNDHREKSKVSHR